MSLELLVGPMFAGKSSALQSIVKRHQSLGWNMLVLNHSSDIRYGTSSSVINHDKQVVPAISIKELIPMLKEREFLYAQLIVIDEAQFFDDGLPDVCNQLANQGIRVIIAGLDMDFKGRPFGPMPHLLAIAEFVTKVHAICMQCGSIAQYSYRFSKNGGQVQLGEKDQYEPRCRKCFVTGMAEQAADIRK